MSEGVFVVFRDAERRNRFWREWCLRGFKRHPGVFILAEEHGKYPEHWLVLRAQAGVWGSWTRVADARAVIRDVMPEFREGVDYHVFGEHPLPGDTTWWEWGK